MLTQSELKELLHYNPETGIFTWVKITGNRVKLGAVAGCKKKNGYVTIGAKSFHIEAHRLAWLYIYGIMPSLDIDHIDGNPSNNKISNLRLATRSENIKNSKKSMANTSGVTGVSWHNRSGKWQARVSINKKQKTIGFYETIDCAKIKYDEYAKAIYGEFFPKPKVIP